MASYITTYKHPPTHIFLPKTHTHSFTRAQPSIYKKCLQIKTHTPIYTYINHFVGAVTVVRLKFCQKYVVVVSGKVELIFYQNPFVSDSGGVWLTLCQKVSAVVVSGLWLLCGWFSIKIISLLLLREWLSFKIIFFVSGDFSAAFCQNVFVGDCG